MHNEATTDFPTNAFSQQVKPEPAETFQRRQKRAEQAHQKCADQLPTVDTRVRLHVVLPRTNLKGRDAQDKPYPRPPVSSSAKDISIHVDFRTLHKLFSSETFEELKKVLIVICPSVQFE